MKKILFIIALLFFSIIVSFAQNSNKNTIDNLARNDSTSNENNNVVIENGAISKQPIEGKLIIIKNDSTVKENNNVVIENGAISKQPIEGKLIIIKNDSTFKKNNNVINEYGTISKQPIEGVVKKEE